MPKDSPKELFTPPPLPVAALGHAERVACLRLIRSDDIGPKRFQKLVNHFGGARKALDARDAWPDLARKTRSGRPLEICSQDRAEAELEAADRIGAVPLFTIEPVYPRAIAHLSMPPPLLYVKGRLEVLQAPMVAIVGARNGSAAGSRMTRLMATRLGEEGFVVVSGLARGIDTAAHEAALPTGTVAVLAGGLDHVYPPENEALQAAIADKGCLISENPPGFRPRGQDFPRRNRIISGVSLGIIVVEAATRSGSLITAHAAAEQGRLVMAVPGHPMDPRAAGPNRLIKDGATMLLTPDDAIAELRPLLENLTWTRGRLLDDATPSALSRRPAEEFDLEPGIAADEGGESDFDPAAPSANELLSHAGHLAGSRPDPVAAVLAVLGPAPSTVDEIARAARLPIHIVSAALLELALSGRIEQHGSQLVSLKPEA
ncbi:MAG: DNA-processing protein DprA [Hyphomicrobiaceae bacterium]